MENARPHPFPIARWIALAILGVWAWAYLRYWGAPDLLYLCNVAVVLTCAGLWFGNRLLLSSQAVATVVIGTLWGIDLAWSVATHGRPLIGGTEYMWDASRPLWVRLLSFDHLAAPATALWAIRRVGYDRRAWAFQSGVAAVVLTGTTMPAILTEISFVSSPADERNLLSSTYRQQIAEALYQGIARYQQSAPHAKIAKLQTSTGR